MAHGSPDFGATAQKSTVYGLLDIAELAVRLGSICTFDRRGDVIFIDDFEASLLKWQVGSLGIGWSATLNNTYARYGAQTVKMVSSTGVGQYVYITRALPIVVPSKIGLEAAFSLGSSEMDFELHAHFYNGTNKYNYKFKYDTDSKAVQIYDVTAGWVTLGTKNLRTLGWLFHQVKLVVDYNSQKFVRLLLNESAYDISAYSPEVSGNDTAPYVAVQIYNIAQVAAASPVIWIDDFIMTQNEP